MIDGQRLVELIEEDWPEFFYPEREIISLYLNNTQKKAC
jgi:hypothetical protein